MIKLNYTILENIFTLEELKDNFKDSKFLFDLLPAGVNYYFTDALRAISVKKTKITHLYKLLINFIFENIKSKNDLKKYLMYQDIVQDNEILVIFLSQKLMNLYKKKVATKIKLLNMKIPKNLTRIIINQNYNHKYIMNAIRYHESTAGFKKYRRNLNTKRLKRVSPSFNRLQIT